MLRGFQLWEFIWLVKWLTSPYVKKPISYLKWRNRIGFFRQNLINIRYLIKNEDFACFRKILLSLEKI